jgi:hypothetical protein
MRPKVHLLSALIATSHAHNDMMRREGDLALS